MPLPWRHSTVVVLNPPNLNYLWGELIIEELVRNGVDQFVISPGSRNAPLVMAAAQNPKAKSTIHTDERGAGFFALGYARSSHKPAVLIATSGTANANYFPAVAEACQSATPLLLLTSDRPVELWETGALQTMDQSSLYGKYVRWFFDFPAPQLEISPRFVLTTIDQAVHRANGHPCGPVQLNCQFREPLSPIESGIDFSGYLQTISGWRQAEKPYTIYSESRSRISGTELSQIREIAGGSRRALIVAGPMADSRGNSNILRAAERLQWPVLADLASGLRFAPEPAQNVLALHDYLLRNTRFAEKVKPDLIVHFGGPPASKLLSQFLARSQSEYIYIDDSPQRMDPDHVVSRRVVMGPADFFDLLLEQDLAAPSGLLDVFKRGEEIAAAALDAFIRAQETCSELSTARLIIKNLPSGHNLFLANSMPIRDAEGSGIKREASIQTGCNRGVSGIDGSVASAAGFASGNGRPTTLILGDLAMLHDLNSLLLARNSHSQIIIVVLNNNGGGIFSFLPIASENPHFENFFATPNNLTFEKAASLFDLSYHCPSTNRDFEMLYLETLSSSKSALIEVKTEREANRRQHQRVWQNVASEVDSLFDA